MFFLFPRLEHPAGWICARYKSLLLLQYSSEFPREGNCVTTRKESRSSFPCECSYGIYFDFLPGSEEVRRVATYHQPSATECLYLTKALPDGNLDHRITDPSSGMVGNIIGSERCLSSCTHTCQPSDVPAVHLPEHHLLVLVPSLWPLHGTPCVHLNHQGVSGSPTLTTCMPLHLLDDWLIVGPSRAATLQAL